MYEPLTCICPGTLLSALYSLAYWSSHPSYFTGEKTETREFLQLFQAHVEGSARAWTGSWRFNYPDPRYYYAIAYFGLFIIPTKFRGILGTSLQCYSLFYVDILLGFKKSFCNLLQPRHEKQTKKLCLVILFVYWNLNWLKLWRRR